MASLHGYNLYRTLSCVQKRTFELWQCWLCEEVFVDLDNCTSFSDGFHGWKKRFLWWIIDPVQVALWWMIAFGDLWMRYLLWMTRLWWRILMLFYYCDICSFQQTIHHHKWELSFNLPPLVHMQLSANDFVHVSGEHALSMRTWNIDYQGQKQSL